MKLKTIAAIAAVLFCVMMGITYQQFSKEQNTQIDMAVLNDQYQNVLNAIRTQEDLSELESRYQCNVLRATDMDYDKAVLEAVHQNDTILDYTVQLENGQEQSGKILFTKMRTDYELLQQSLLHRMIVLFLILSLICLFLFVLVYVFYIRPFHKLRRFATDVAQGNLDAPLQMHRNNFFGAFTESFDLMREELKKARQNEYQANIRKKELVAELSHDMKTPLATIKATCEVLSVKMQMQIQEQSKVDDETESMSLIEDYASKVDLIERKADTIDQLIGNMFHATLEELEVLKVEPVLTESTVIQQILADAPDLEPITIKNEIPECLVYMDQLRLKQVIDNIINNSDKYAKTNITISFEEETDGIILVVRDDGPGVKEEELAAITQKFYRGSNAQGENGTGLGLYLSRYFMEQMKGGFECLNDHGFVVRLFLKKAS